MKSESREQQLQNLKIVVFTQKKRVYKHRIASDLPFESAQISPNQNYIIHHVYMEILCYQVTLLYYNVLIWLLKQGGDQSRFSQESQHEVLSS